MKLPFAPTLATCLALLIACNERPPTSTSPPPSPPAAAPAADTATRVTLSPQDTLLVVGAAPEPGDVPALHQPFEEVRNVAPGLQVVVASVPVPAAVVVREPSERQLVLTIKQNRRVIFRDTTGDGLAYTEYSEPTTARLYPLWIPTGPGAGQLLVAYSNRPLKDRVRRFHLHHQRVMRLDTLPTFDGPPRDVDQDGRLEFAGLDDYGDGLADAQGRPLAAYNPVLYYEVRPAGLVLDSALTRRRAIARYGAFHGFAYSDKLTFPAR